MANNTVGNEEFTIIFHKKCRWSIWYLVYSLSGYISDISKVISSLLRSLSSLLLLFKCPPPAAMHFTALAFMSIIALLSIAGSICATWLEIWQQKLSGAQAESSWYPSYCRTPLQERIAEGLGVLLVFAKFSYGFLTVNSNICHGQFWLKEVFLRHPVWYLAVWYLLIWYLAICRTCIAGLGK